MEKRGCQCLEDGWQPSSPGDPSLRTSQAGEEVLSRGLREGPCFSQRSSALTVTYAFLVWDFTGTYVFVSIVALKKCENLIFYSTCPLYRRKLRPQEAINLSNCSHGMGVEPGQCTPLKLDGLSPTPSSTF